jgi:hypothetical protein
MSAWTRPALVLVIAFSAAGCSKSPAQRLEGRWLGESVEGVPADQLAKASGWAKGTAIQFSGSKATVTIPAEAPRTGTFRVSKVEGDVVTVAFNRQEGGRDQATFEIVPGDKTLRWKLDGGAELVFAKQKL